MTDRHELYDRIATLATAAAAREADREEARDALENAGHPGVHIDDWPRITPAVHALIAERDGLHGRLEAAETAAAELTRELDGRTAEARERWITKQEQQLGLKHLEFRAGRWEMGLAMAREMGAAYVAMAKALLGDAPNYTETRLEFDVKVAESPELYTLVVQRHAPGVLTPHEARQRAEAERDALRYRLDSARDAAALHRQGLITSAELYAVIEALDGPPQPHTGPTEAPQEGPAAPSAPRSTPDGVSDPGLCREPSDGRTRCANCGREVENRAEPSMGWPARDHWVHIPGAYEPCHPERGADSPRAEPKTTRPEEQQ